jgi:DNA-binding MarR family transcriptional regulator
MRSRRGGLSIPQFRTLQRLERHPGVSLSDLSEFLGMTRPSASKLVQKLVTDGLVDRKTGDDRRRVHLFLTARGNEVIAAARLEAHRQLAEYLDSLSREELAEVSAALRTLGRVLPQTTPDVNVP